MEKIDMSSFLLQAIASQVATAVCKALTQLGVAVVDRSFSDVTNLLSEKIGKKVAGLFSTIVMKLENKESGKEALQDALHKPEDELNIAVLTKQIQKLMEADAAFATELKGLLEESETELNSAGIHVTISGSGAAALFGGTASGAGGIAIGGDVSGSVTKPTDKP